MAPPPRPEEMTRVSTRPASGAAPRESAPVLLIHGLGGPAMWERVLPILESRRRVIVPRLPGFGGAPPGAQPMSAPECADWIAGQLADGGGLLNGDTLAGIAGPLTVAGVSWGGEIAAHLAARHPALVGALVLIAPTGARPMPRILRLAPLRGLLRRLLPLLLTRRWIAERMSRLAFHDLDNRPSDLVDRYLHDLRPSESRRVLGHAVAEILGGEGRLPGIIREIDVPVTLLRGREDRTIPPATDAAIEAARPGIRAIVLPECGHSLPLEKPGELAAILAP